MDKLGLIIILLFMAISSAKAETPQNRVNYHLRKMQTTLDTNETNGKINVIKIQNEKPATSTVYEVEKNHPLYGVEDSSAAPLMHIEQNNYDGPTEDLTAEEIIRNEAQSRQVSSKKTPTEEEQKADFIRQLKENARAKGIKLEVDPVTLEVRRVR